MFKFFIASGDTVYDKIRNLIQSIKINGKEKNIKVSHKCLDARKVLEGDVVYSCFVNFFPKLLLLTTARDRITGLTQAHRSYERNKLLREFSRD